MIAKTAIVSDNVFKVLKQKSVNPGFSIQEKIAFKNESKIKDFFRWIKAETICGYHLHYRNVKGSS